MALSQSKAFIILVTPSSVTMHVHTPGTRQHSLSRWQLFAFSSGSKTMVSFDGIFHVIPSYVRSWAYCGRILSVPSRSSSLMDFDFAILKYTQAGSVVVLVMAYRQEKQSFFCGLWPILVVPDVIEDAGYVVSLLLSIMDFGRHVRVIVSSLAVRCQIFTTRYCFAHGMVANGIAFLLQCRFRSWCVVNDRHVVAIHIGRSGQWYTHHAQIVSDASECLSTGLHINKVSSKYWAFNGRLLLA